MNTFKNGYSCYARGAGIQLEMKSVWMSLQMKETGGKVKIHIIRHGSTLANEKKLYCGQTDLPLSRKGIDEINHYKKMGIYPKAPDLFFVSNLIRTKETLSLIYGSVEGVPISQFAEFNFGRFEMKSYEELKEQPEYHTWAYDEAGLAPCPDGECKQQFTQRVLEGFEALTKRTTGANEIFVVCHGGVIVSIMEHLFSDTYHFYEWLPKTGRGYTLIRNINKCYKYNKI